MIIKIGDQVFDSSDEKNHPMMIVMSDKDRENINNMSPNARKICIYNSDNYTEEEIRAWMGDL